MSSNMTKRALADSLKKLMEKKPLSKITIKDITEECGVNRHTFYYHFKDIYDLVEWIYISESENALGGSSIHGTWQQGMRQLFAYALNNKKFIMGTFRSLSKEYLTKFLYRQAFDLIHKVVEEESETIPISEEKKNFVANFYAYAIGGIVLSWIEKGMRQDPEEITEMLIALIQGEGKNALYRLADS